MRNDWNGKELQLNEQCWAVEREDRDGYVCISRPCSTRQSARDMQNLLMCDINTKRATVIKVCVIREPLREGGLT